MCSNKAYTPKSSAVHVELAEEVVEDEQNAEGAGHGQTSGLDPSEDVEVVRVELELLRGDLAAVGDHHGFHGEVIRIGFYL